MPAVDGPKHGHRMRERTLLWLVGWICLGRFLEGLIQYRSNHSEVRFKNAI